MANAMVPIVVFILGVLLSHHGAAAAACTTNSQCTGFGELCITYYNYAKGQKCATSKKCTGTLGPACFEPFSGEDLPQSPEIVAADTSAERRSVRRTLSNASPTSDNAERFEVTGATSSQQAYSSFCYDFRPVWWGCPFRINIHGLLLENTATRCGLFTCPFLNVCAYEATGTNCAIGTCPCYGRYRTKCVFNPDAYFACGLDTIPIVSSTGVVTCNGCQSATTVLTGP